MRNLMLAAVATFTFSAPALAVSVVTTPGALGATDFIDWEQLGSDFTALPTPIAISSDGFKPAKITSAGGSVSRMTQGNTWIGNFTTGDFLVWTRGKGPDLTIIFQDPVAGAGAQWQANVPGAFGANLAAYDAADVLLGTVTRDGDSTFAGDGSAIFLGVLSDSVNISKIVLTLDYAANTPNDFAINRLLLTGTPGGGGVIPEPATWAMLIAGFGMIGCALRNRRGPVGVMARRRKVAAAA